MKTEKIVISFIAVTIGILVAGGAFYAYQTTKIVSTEGAKTVSLTATITPTPQKSQVVLQIDSPKDEDVIATKIVTITGKTNPDAIIVITTSSNDQVVTPAVNGSFSTTAVLDSGENVIEIRAIAKNGEETKVIRTVTVSTESF